MSITEDGGKLHADHWSTEYDAHLLQTSERKRATYRRVLRGLHVFLGLTDDELRRYLGGEGVASKSGPATRRGELVEMGLVRPQRYTQTDEVAMAGDIVKRPSDLGGPMIVWEVVPVDELPPVPDAQLDGMERPMRERQPKAKGLEVARRKMEWDLGDGSYADAVLRAYLNPEVVARELDESGA